MKHVLTLTPYVMLLVVLVAISCQRELPCFDCLNKPPVANAGIDQKIIIPQDSVVLDGSFSNDEDGTIARWLWTKISGPSSCVIASPTSTSTKVKNLAAGVYSFELNITDDKGAEAKDTVIILVDNPLVNEPPVACAGADQNIVLPTNLVMLRASCSTDPDNNIMSYKWSKIAGPSVANIARPDSAVTQVTGLVEGAYQFEVKVTDSGALFSTDTIKVTVKAAIVAVSCGESNRPVISVKLIPIATLSEPGTGMAVASAGNKIIFTGASVSGNPPNYGSNKVHILDVSTQAWSTATLSASRADVAAVSAGNKIFIAGGRLGNLASMGEPISYSYFTTVDVFDVATNSWSVTNLSQPRAYITAASVGDKVLFAGGEQPWPQPVSDRVDIYDLGANAWTTASLSVPRNGIAAVKANNKILFAGGSNHLGGVNHVSKVIDVYDNASASWSAINLSEPKAFFSGINVDNKIYWAGGEDGSGNPSCNVEIMNLATQMSSQAFLFHPYNYVANEGQNAVVKDNQIIWFASINPFNGNETDRFNIYHTITKTWSIGVLPFRMSGASVISVNNIIYVAGGYINGKLSDKVWKLEL